MTLTRRMVLLITLMFWQGGFMFYGAVVVPVGAEVLGSHRAQGRLRVRSALFHQPHRENTQLVAQQHGTGHQRPASGQRGGLRRH